MKHRGEISVFLVLILSVLSSFIIVLIMHVRTFISRGEAAYAMDNAVRSCFAEYNQAVFQEFHILLIDSSYKGTDAGCDAVADHFSTYLENSMTVNSLDSVHLEVVPVSDDQMYAAAVSYEETKTGIDDRVSEDGYYLEGFKQIVMDYARQNGSPGFDLDRCYTQITFHADISDRAGDTFSLERDFSYDR